MGPFATPLRVPLLVSLVVYQAAWFACVAAAAAGQVALGLAAIAACVALQLAASTHRRADAVLIGAAVLLGLVWDTVLARTGTISYASPGPWPGVAPVWILALWAQLAVLLREPLRWLHGRPVVSAVLGGVGGALSYAAAARMGACQFAEPTQALAVLAMGWGLFTPALLALAQRLDTHRITLREARA